MTDGYAEEKPADTTAQPSQEESAGGEETNGQ